VAGDQLGNTQLANIGREAEAHHDDMQRDFNDLTADLFVQQAVPTGGVDSSPATMAQSRDM